MQLRVKAPVRIALAVLLLACGIVGITHGAPTKATGDPYQLVASRGASHPDYQTALQKAKANATGVTAASIFGQDDRVPVLDTTASGVRAVARIVEFDGAGDLISECTGTLLTKHVVLTAAHCLYRDDSYVFGVLVIPGEAATDEPFGIGEAFEMAVPAGWITLQDLQLDRSLPSPHDWGIVIVQSPPWGDELAPYPVVAHAPTDYLNDSDTYLATIGFPGDKPEGSMWATWSDTRVVDQVFVHTDMDVVPGQSGSPIYAINGEVEFIFSVVSLSGRFANVSSRFTPSILESLVEFSNSHGHELVTYEIPANGPPPTFPPPTLPAAGWFDPSANPAGGAGLEYRLALPFVGRD